MKDIAKACGVSVVTVSRALRGHPGHSPATRERIGKVAESMGYRPNPMVAALMSERGRRKPGKGIVNLGLLDLSGIWRGHLFLAGCQAQAERLGFSAELFRLLPGAPAAKSLRRILQSRGVRGLIVLPAPHAHWQLEFDLGDFAAATIGYSIESPELPRVITDTYGRLMQAFAEVEKRGYRRVGLLTSGDLDLRFRHQITAALEVFRHTRKTKCQIHCLEVEPPDANWIDSRVLRKWIQTKRIDVLLSPLAEQFERLVEEGVRIPGEFAYVHLHRHPNPAVAQFDQMQEAIGRKAVDVVVAMIYRNEFALPADPQTVLIPSRWFEGMTCPVKK